MIRVEDKYWCSERDMLLLQARVKIIMRPDPYSGDRPYRITSLYFDDSRDSHWSDSEEGISHRTKYRIRIYNNSQDVIRLEVKTKAYNRVDKKARTISREEAARLIAGECIEDHEESVNNPVTLFNLAIRKDLLRPKAVIDYERTAYTFSPGNVRVTFDRNLRVSADAAGFLNGSCMFEPVRETDRILEIKYDELLPGFIARLLESGNMNQTAYSKYRLGREQLERRR